MASEASKQVKSTKEVKGKEKAPYAHRMGCFSSRQKSLGNSKTEIIGVHSSQQQKYEKWLQRNVPMPKAESSTSLCC